MPDEGTVPSPAFATTRWTLVLAAGDRHSETGRQALEQLCRAYWYPLYAFVRRRGCDPHTAQDLTQGFFARLLEGDRLSGVSREGGKFRSYLLAAFRHYLTNEHSRETSQKRGGGRSPISLEEAAAEDRYLREPADEASPDRLYDRQWARTLMEQALQRLADEQSATGKEGVFATLRVYLGRDPEAGEYAGVALGLGMAPGTVAVQVHRLRERYRMHVRAAVADTVDSPLEIDQEMRHLLAALAS